jgi:formate hydrogenlyase subunit 3/multisubunit Na+/H+ antiporter MnhD subunit
MWVSRRGGQTCGGSEEGFGGAMHTMKVFMWWFLVGATMALAVIMLQGGIREVMQAQGSVWELKLMELMTTILGGGLLGGCIALILDRIKKA